MRLWSIHPKYLDIGENELSLGVGEERAARLGQPARLIACIGSQVLGEGLNGGRELWLGCIGGS